MSSQPIDRHSPVSEEFSAERVGRTERRRHRVRLAMPYFQGDFARGQRARSVPVAVVGTFANRREAN